MLAAGFAGQGMREQPKAEMYILLAADNPNVESELPEQGLRFWAACDFQYRVWQARQRLGLPMALSSSPLTSSSSSSPSISSPAPSSTPTNAVGVELEAGAVLQQAEVEKLFNFPVAVCLQREWIEKYGDREYMLTPFGAGRLKPIDNTEVL